MVIPTEQVVAGDVVLITCLTHEAITEEHPVRPGIKICFIRTDGGASPGTGRDAGRRARHAQLVSAMAR